MYSSMVLALEKEREEREREERERGGGSNIRRPTFFARQSYYIQRTHTGRKILGTSTKIRVNFMPKTERILPEVRSCAFLINHPVIVAI